MCSYTYCKGLRVPFNVTQQHILWQTLNSCVYRHTYSRAYSYYIPYIQTVLRRLYSDLVFVPYFLESRCGFESDESDQLCGWKLESLSGPGWQRLAGNDQEIVTRNRGIRFDHTYGPSKHSGTYVGFAFNPKVPVLRTQWLVINVCERSVECTCTHAHIYVLVGQFCRRPAVEEIGI